MQTDQLLAGYEISTDVHRLYTMEVLRQGVYQTS
jgi:hypothetical protein